MKCLRHFIPFGGNMKKLACACLVAVGLGLSAPANAADAFTSQDEIDSKIDIAFGATFTSRYVSRGETLSNGPALQGYVEASYDWAYAGVWASNVSDPFDNVEIDLYAGIRPTFGDLTLDLGYVHYFYDRTGSCCGEIYGKASYDFPHDFTTGVELYYDPRFKTTYGAATASLALPYDFSVSGGFGTWFDGNRDWNAGISYTYAETLTFDLRYHDSNHSPRRFVASVSMDSSLSALRGLMRRY
jgi:uncharacterized protein (TIGR02001 family)